MYIQTFDIPTLIWMYIWISIVYILMTGFGISMTQDNLHIPMM